MTIISAAQREKLDDLGFGVEDMEAAYGKDWTSCFRWYNDDLGLFEESEITSTADAAWVDCWNYAVANGMV